MKTVMIVDDSAPIRNILKNALMQDFSIVEAEHGLQALEKLPGQAVDLFLLDVNMPQMDGLTLLGKLRQHPNHTATPILMLTTETKDELRDQGRQLGASGWVLKPCEPDKLLSTIHKLI